MKIIRADSVNYLDDFIRHIESGIVLLGEGSFDTDIKELFDEDSVVKATRNYPVSIVGVRTDDDGSVCYILRQGRMQQSQKKLSLGPKDSRDDTLYDVSPNAQKINAIIRICADYDAPYRGIGSADLLMIPHAAIEWGGLDKGIPDLIKAHNGSLQPHGLIVTSGMMGAEQIYNLKGKIVSQQKRFRDLEYHEAQLTRVLALK